MLIVTLHDEIGDRRKVLGPYKYITRRFDFGPDVLIQSEEGPVAVLRQGYWAACNGHSLYECMTIETLEVTDA